MKRGARQVIKLIQRSVHGLADTPVFREWLRTAKVTAGDVVVINNSFIYRKPLIKTPKNGQYLCLKVKGTQPDTKNVFVATPGDINSDFKLFSAKSANLPTLESLDKSLQKEISRLGRLMFVLIGALRDVPDAVPVNHGVVKKLEFNPSIKRQAVLQDAGGGKKTITIRQLTDPGTSWNAVKPKLEQEVGNDLSEIEAAFGVAFEKLRDKARLRLVLPTRTTLKTSTSFIARLRESVSEQRKLYEAALQKLTNGDAMADAHLREVMRIAYNFADDAIKVLQLLVSIADLKAVLLWSTVKEHFDLAEAFRNLPWTKSHKKPSLGRYREIIAGTRNHAFHDLLAFDRTIEADLDGVSVKARRLTLLPAHGSRKKTVPFDYEDRELVEILAELTRAPEIAVPLNFWKKNVKVIESFERLLESTERALWALNKTRADGH